MSGSSVIEVRSLRVLGRKDRAVLDGVSINLPRNKITAIVGESGSGKSTLLNCMLGLLPHGLTIVEGEVFFASAPANGRIDLMLLTDRERRAFLGREIGYVPQDGQSGLDPLMAARSSILEAARMGLSSASAPGERAEAAMRKAGLDDAFIRKDVNRRPGRLSGGQCQRICIAQAIVNDPPVILMDEPTASLDPLTRQGVLDTVKKLAEGGAAVAIVTHDLGSVASVADWVVVMYLSRVVESGKAADVFRDPKHPYTKGLLDCLPRIDARASLKPIRGEIPEMPSEILGCKFNPRCDVCEARCLTVDPDLRDVGAERKVACHVA